MKRVLVLLLIVLCLNEAHSQAIAQKLAKAIQLFEADSQMRHAITGICVADAKTGKTVYAHNAQMGLAPASTQKIFTSAAAFDILGHDYTYATKLGYYGKLEDSILNGGLYIMASGDPTLGSWRFATTRESVVMDKWVEAVKKLKIRWVENMIVCNYYDFEEQSIPGGWIWDDIGNYYGASAEIFNWRENQYDIILRSGDQVGDPVKIIKIEPEYFAPYQYTNNLKTAAKGTGDNAYIYSNGRGLFQLVGTIPAGEKAFTISGSTTVNGIVAFDSLLRQNKVFVQWPCFPEMPQIKMRSSDQINVIHTHYSPPLDSINYWFLKKSVNLYGEALIKTFAYKKTGFGSTEKGVELLKDFWMQHGIDKGSVNIMDGSGLSPQNRVTADAEVKVLQYAKTRPWFNSFFNALPEFNGMKMKSGAIGGARAYTGYHTASNGARYIFSIIVNNYTGSSSEAVKKIYKVLDVLK